MFRRLHSAGERVTIWLDGERIEARAGESVAAAMLAAGARHFRTTPVSGAPRGPWCMMGACFDCLVEIDGEPSIQACMTSVREGMRIARQAGAREIAP